MNSYIGLDGHSKSCTFVVLDEKGSVKRRAVVETNGQALIEFINQIPGRRYLCLEEGDQSQWLYELLSPFVHDMAIVHGRKRQGNKDDGRDAYNLAHRFRIGDLGPRIFKTPTSLTTLKAHVRSYETLTRDLVRVKNRIKHLHRSHGIGYVKQGCPLCTHAGGNGSGCTKPGFHQSLMLWREQQEKLESLKSEAQKAMLAEASRNPIMRVLKTTPGFGPVRSAELLAIVITPYRFRTSRQFWCYCGLAVVQRSSADWVMQPNGQWRRAPVYQTRGLNQNYNRQAKAIFKGAAMTVIISKSQESLRTDYERLLAHGTKPNLARLTIARKIAAIVLSMWKHQQRYEPRRYQVDTH